MHHIKEFLSAMTNTIAAWGPWGVMLLAFLDSAGLSVSMGMDALIILMGVKAPGTVWYAAALAVVGSLAGNLILFYGARKGGQRYAAAHAPTPGSPQRFRNWFARYGLATVFIPALLPIPLPLKVFVVTAGVLGTPVRSFVLVIVAARVIRYFGEAYLGVKLGQDSLPFLKQHVWALTGIGVALFALIYFWLRWSGRSGKSR